MNGRVILISLLAAGCAAAVPATHHLSGPDAAWHHGAHGRALGGGGAHGPERMHARIDAALDALGLAPDVRARTKAILEARFAEAHALIERLHADEIGPDAAHAEHDRILASARRDLATVLTEEQIRKLHEALHPEGRSGRAE